MASRSPRTRSSRRRAARVLPAAGSAGNHLTRSRNEWYAGTMELLTEAQLAGELAAVPDWSRHQNQISRQVSRADFGDALRYVNAVGYLAERAGHHPDIAIAWNAVTLTLSTHSAGGLTAADFALARQIDELLPGKTR